MPEQARPDGQEIQVRDTDQSQVQGLRPKTTLVKKLSLFVRRKPLGTIGGAIICLLLVVAALAPYIRPFDPYEIHGDAWLGAPGSIVSLEGGGTGRLLLGGDELGRDILSRIIVGSRISIYVGILSVGIGITLGMALGILSGYVGGTFDLVLQRIVDAIIPFPPIILGMAIISVMGTSVNNVILALIIIFIPRASRIVRSQVLSIKEAEFVEASKAIGCGASRIMFRHIFPNVLATYIIVGTISLGLAIITEASLSFLGVGVPPDVPSWGGMSSAAVEQYIELSPWLALFPGLAIALVVFGFNLLGDALRDVLDPRLRM